MVRREVKIEAKQIGCNEGVQTVMWPLYNTPLRHERTMQHCPAENYAHAEALCALHVPEEVHVSSNCLLFRGLQKLRPTARRPAILEICESFGSFREGSVTKTHPAACRELLKPQLGVSSPHRSLTPESPKSMQHQHLPGMYPTPRMTNLHTLNPSTRVNKRQARAATIDLQS